MIRKRKRKCKQISKAHTVCVDEEKGTSRESDMTQSSPNMKSVPLANGMEMIYIVVKYHTRVHEEEVEKVIGTFSTLEEADQAVLTSSNELEDGDWEEHKVEPQNNSTLSLYTTGSDSETYTTVVDVREEKIDASEQLNTVYVIKKETRQYASRAPGDEVVRVDILDVFKHKEAADWFVRRQNIFTLETILRRGWD